MTFCAEHGSPQGTFYAIKRRTSKGLGVLPRRLCAWRELKGEDLRYRYRLRHSFDQTEALISYVTHRHVRCADA
jgi:hypothetical protein